MQRSQRAACASAGRLNNVNAQLLAVSSRRRPCKAVVRHSLVVSCLASRTPQLEPSKPAVEASTTYGARAGAAHATPEPERPGPVAPDAAAGSYETSGSLQSHTQLLKQLLRLSSTDSMDGDYLPSPPHHHSGSSSAAHQAQQHHLPQRQAAVAQSRAMESSSSSSRSSSSRGVQQQSSSLYEDASAADYDPMLLDLMGFTSVAQYLQHKLDAAYAQTKVELLHATAWLSLGAGLITPMGGYAAYLHLIHKVTQGGAATDNLTFVWLLLVVYYMLKGGVMSLATGWRAMSAHAAEPEQLQELQQLQSQHQRRAYWQLQERLMRYDNRANRCYAEFALASLVLGMLLLMKGGADNLQMQLETVDQGALSQLLLMMGVFWECYFSSIAAAVQLVQLGGAWLSKLQHKQKWEQGNQQ